MKGCFEAQPDPEPFEEIMRELSKLDLRTDTQIVTVIAMLWENDDGEESGIFKFLAGTSSAFPEEKSESFLLRCKTLKNNSLYELVRIHCQHKLSQTMDSTRVELWESKSPLFVVTSEVPDVTLLADDVFSDIAIAPERLEKKEQSDHQQVFVFRHPYETDVEIEITEPASPSPVRFSRRNVSVTKNIEHSAKTKDQQVSGTNAAKVGKVLQGCFSGINHILINAINILL